MTFSSAHAVDEKLAFQLAQTETVLKRHNGNCQVSCRAFNLSSSFFLAAFFNSIVLCFQPFIRIQ